MHIVALTHETDFEGWRNAARALALNDIAPNDVAWTVASRETGLFESTPLPAASGNHSFNVPFAFVRFAQYAILNRNPERFSRLYQLLFRLRKNSRLMESTVDVDVVHVVSLTKEVRRDEHKMHAFVRFREFGRGPDERFVAWFEPAHHIVELAAPFFERRFADMAWSILTPDRCAHWNGHKTIFTGGAIKSSAPSSDSLEDIWRTYYANIFNPARLKIKAMRAEMPKKYWRNLPEASLIDPLIADASRIAQTMIDSEAPAPRAARQQRKEALMQPAADGNITAKSDGLAGLRAEAADCRACPLWKDATQTVFGEGLPNASIMLVGEQPGDKEDIAGKPFVGPAGQILNRALREAGIERDRIYVTNAVKHFKFVPRGKIRLHQKPNTSEIRACRQWYERERAEVRPALIVAMGATAAQSVIGRSVPIGKNRGHLIDVDGAKALVTIHPSYLLRLPHEEAKAREYATFVNDLKFAASYVQKLKAA